MPPEHAHDKGMESWCLAAGPERIDTDFAFQVFLDVRWRVVRTILKWNAAVLIDLSS